MNFKQCIVLAACVFTAGHALYGWDQHYLYNDGEGHMATEGDFAWSKEKKNEYGFIFRGEGQTEYGRVAFILQRGKLIGTLDKKGTLICRADHWGDEDNRAFNFNVIYNPPKDKQEEWNRIKFTIIPKITGRINISLTPNDSHPKDYKFPNLHYVYFANMHISGSSAKSPKFDKLKDWYNPTKGVKRLPGKLEPVVVRNAKYPGGTAIKTCIGIGQQIEATKGQPITITVSVKSDKIIPSLR